MSKASSRVLPLVRKISTPLSLSCHQRLCTSLISSYVQEKDGASVSPWRLWTNNNIEQSVQLMLSCHVVPLLQNNSSPGCHDHRRHCPPQNTSQTFLWHSIESVKSHWNKKSITIPAGCTSCATHEVLPKSSSPDVSRDGATLMHRLVNLKTKKHNSVMRFLFVEQVICVTILKSCSLRVIWCLLKTYRQHRKTEGENPTW